VVSGVSVQVSGQPLAAVAASLIANETSACAGIPNGAKKANVEYRTRNFECRRNVSCLFNKKRRSAAIPFFDILRFNILLFCGSLFSHVESHMRSPRCYILTPET
jgi:hypothetical protein